jgi:glycosyltransferase involved in cell wall biosynthesis
MITVFTPSFADEANTNAQNLTVKEIVSRLPPDRFRVILLGHATPDPRISARENTEILPITQHGNALRWLTRVLLSKVDVYFFPRLGPLDAFFMFLRRSLKLPVALVTYIVMALNEIPVEPAMENSIRDGDLVFGNSRFVSQTIHERFGVSAGTIYDGVNRQFFHPPANRRPVGSKLTVLYAGSLQARKRVNIVIAEAAKRPDIEFRLAGKGEEENKCRALVNELKCHNVTFLGHISQEGLADEMRRADVFLFPSVLEGHPQVLGQAAATGLPAVAMNFYRPDFIVNGETGYLVESENEISHRLGLLLSDIDLRSKMSAAAVKHAAHFDWGKVAKDWEMAFVEAVSKRRKKPHSQPTDTIEHRDG